MLTGLCSVSAILIGPWFSIAPYIFPKLTFGSLRSTKKIDEPTFPRGSIHANPEAHFRSVYMQAYDNKAECIVSRFDQQDFLTYKNIQNLFLKSVRGESYTSELQTVCEIYRDDIKQDEIYCKIDY